jgi:histidine triad (HIT) family protein
MRATYGCDGTSVRQHNEPAGDSAVRHYHVHVFPRYVDDGLYGSLPDSGYRTAAEPLPYAEKLRAYFACQANAGVQG